MMQQEQIVKDYKEAIRRGDIAAREDTRFWTKVYNIFFPGECRHQWHKLAEGGFLTEAEFAYCTHCLRMGKWWIMASSENTGWHFTQLVAAKEAHDLHRG